MGGVLHQRNRSRENLLKRETSAKSMIVVNKSLHVEPK